MSTLKVDTIVEKTTANGVSVDGVSLKDGGATLSDNLLFNASGKGVYLGVTTATASNLLDDYEEGNWTPNYSTEGGGESITYDGPTGKYIKVGQMVYITGYLRTDAFSGGSSYLYLGGFPFTNATGNAFKSFIGISRATNWGGDTPSAGEIVDGGTKAFLKFRSSANGASDNILQSDVSGSANSNVLFFSGTYKSST